MLDIQSQIRQFEADLTGMCVDIGNAQRQVAREALRPILREMKSLCPVDTGATKKALKITTPRSGLGKVVSLEVTDIEVNGRRPYLYAPYADAKRPWFTKVWNKHEDRLPEYISKGLGEVVEDKAKAILAKSAKL